MHRKIKTVIALSLIPQYFLVKLLGNYPEFIEMYYSNGVYQFISKIFRYTLGWLPFSFGDFMYAFAIIYVIRWFILNRKRLRKDTIKWFVDIATAFSVFYFTFHILWGLNYYRLPLHENLKLNADYSAEELVSITEKLVYKANEMHLKITKNDTVRVEMPYDESTILKMTPDGYNNLKRIFPHLEYHPKSIKKSLFSYPLSYMGFSGYLNPITNEAQVNYLIPAYKIPTTSSHEIAHQLGYAAENEANFIGCLAAINHDDVYFKYSGYVFGLSYCLNELYFRDECLYEDVIADVNIGILKNYQESRNFWEAHQNITEPVFKLFYNNYLKANKQDKGLESYSYVVALIVNYFNEKSL